MFIDSPPIRRERVKAGHILEVFTYFAATTEEETGYPVTKSEWRDYYREMYATGGE